MIQFQATLVQRDSLAPAWWRLVIAPNSQPAGFMPGQFFVLRCGDGFSPYLRRPIYPQPLPGNRLALLLRPGGDRGLAWLAARQPGDSLDLIGPLGTGFSLPPDVRHLLLVSDSQELAPLLGQLEPALAGNMSITLALAGQRAANLYPAAALPPAVELQLATLDGSTGHHGPLTDLLPNLLRWADRVHAVGSTRLYHNLKYLSSEARLALRPGFVFGLRAEALLPCGVGACFGCTVTTAGGPQLTCVDGPVFDLAQLELEGVS